MKTTISVTVDADLVAEARGRGISFSAFVNEALQEKMHKELSNEEVEQEKLEFLQKIKMIAHQKSELYPEKFVKCVRYVKYLGIKSYTTDEKITFWSAVVEEMKKEIPPEPPKEKH